jgi:2-dehydropantoate 2-reductase
VPLIERATIGLWLAMRLVILGTGAIGGAVGGFLAEAGRDVALIARGAQRSAIAEVGLRVETPDRAFVVRPPVVDSASRIDWRAGDVVLLAVKTQDAGAALRELTAAAPGAPVVCLTNGLEAERLALRHTPDVYAACVMMPATYLVPGVVQVWSAPAPGVIDLGRYPGGSRPGGDEQAAAIASELRAAAFVSDVCPDIERWKRGKLLANVANMAEALCGRGARRSEVATRARGEAIACFDAAGLPYASLAESEARYAAVHPRPIEGAKRAGGSTWQSLARGARSLETDYLNGEIVLLGRLHGVATPVNALLQRLGADAARRGLAPGSMPLAELEALAETVRSPEHQG